MATTNLPLHLQAHSERCFLHHLFVSRLLSACYRTWPHVRPSGQRRCSTLRAIKIALAGFSEANAGYYREAIVFSLRRNRCAGAKFPHVFAHMLCSASVNEIGQRYTTDSDDNSKVAYHPLKDAALGCARVIPCAGCRSGVED